MTNTTAECFIGPVYAMTPEESDEVQRHLDSMDRSPGDPWSPRADVEFENDTDTADDYEELQTP